MQLVLLLLVVMLMAMRKLRAGRSGWGECAPAVCRSCGG